MWLNEALLPFDLWRSQIALGMDDLLDAKTKFDRYAPLLKRLFPELESSGGTIESPLRKIDTFRREVGASAAQSGRWFIKADHALPVVGSIKARGGFFEVLRFAEELATRNNLVEIGGGLGALASAEARALFREHDLVVGSTGNLGLSVGTIGSALGFATNVHMSADAKRWKKDRLRALGVEVIEHEGDYGQAVAAARTRSSETLKTYFVDDEDSRRLFLGYSVAAFHLREQLRCESVDVDKEHPLFVYVPCGVGGAPGGITFGLRHLFGDDVHCFFAEPTAAPSMLVRLAADGSPPTSIGALALDGRTEADGLAVASVSEFVAKLMEAAVSGIFTVTDGMLMQDLHSLWVTEGLKVEPSAAASLRGPSLISSSAIGRAYVERNGLSPHMSNATHILWTTGGALVPHGEFQDFLNVGASLTRSSRHG